MTAKIVLVAAMVAASPQMSNAQVVYVPTTRSAEELLTAFSRDTTQTRRGEAGDVIRNLFYRSELYPRTKVDSLFVGLEVLAVRNGGAPVAGEAVSTLSAAGYRRAPHPISGIVARLARIYRRTSDPAVRMRVLGTLPLQAERSVAIAFARRIAMQEPGHEDFPDAVHEAIRVLLALGDEGRATVYDLHRRGLVRVPEERHNLELLARDGFWARGGKNP